MYFFSAEMSFFFCLNLLQVFHSILNVRMVLVNDYLFTCDCELGRIHFFLFLPIPETSVLPVQENAITIRPRER